MAEELLVLDALGGGSFAPKTKAGGLERFSHVGNDLLSVRPVTLRISSKVIRSAQAAQIIQSGLSLDGSGFLTRVTGLSDCLGFIL
jgi:hypothetical protein